MSSGLQELLMWPIELIGRGGKRAAGAAVVVGVALGIFGLWLTYGLLGPEKYWPIMLSVVVLGGAVMVAGLAVLFGSQAKLAKADTSVDHTTHIELQTASLPFWVCGQCRILRHEFTMVGRCSECASVIDYMKVESEADRKFAMGLLS